MRNIGNISIYGQQSAFFNGFFPDVDTVKVRFVL